MSRAIQLRYLSTLTEIAGDKNSTIVFPLPIDLVESLASRLLDRVEAGHYDDGYQCCNGEPSELHESLRSSDIIRTAT